MRMLWSGAWLIILLLSIAWMAVGLVGAAEIMPGDNVVADLSGGVESLALAIGADQLAFYSLPLFVVISGLPVFFISALILKLSGRASPAAENKSSESDVPLPFPQQSESGEKPKNRRVRRQTLAVSALAFVAVFVFWRNPDAELLLYPLRLFVTFVHEAGHALAALISGGQVHSFTVSANGSGYAVTAGGNMALILPAGYLGAALFGSLLYLLSNRLPRALSGLAILLGLVMLTLSALYARPDETGSPLSMVIGIGFGALMLLLGGKAPQVVNQFVLSTLAILTALEAVMDLWYLVSHSDAGTSVARNDAAVFAAEITPLLPASVIAFLWAAIAAAMLGAAVYFGTIKPLRQEIGLAVNSAHS